LGKVCDIILLYAKNINNLKYRVLYQSKGLEADDYSDDPLKSDGFRTTTTVPFNYMNIDWPCSPNEHWKVPIDDLRRVAKTGRLIPKKTSLRVRKYASDFGYMVYHSVWMGFGGASDMRYVVETNAKVVERCMHMVTDPGDLVFDPTCGSGTTAFVAEKLGRRWITCDTSRVAVTLAKQRLMTSSFDYFRLRYPHEGLSGGFEYETASHVTLNSIAKNPDIDSIHNKMHPAILAALNSLNDALLAAPPPHFKPGQGYRKGKPVTFASGERLEEWEVPVDFPVSWPDAARRPFDDFHAAQQAMQALMEQSIKDHADPEILYDKPKKDDTRLRITGPFSVEAVPAPTVLSLDETAQPAEADATVARSGETSRQTQWRDELIRTGIRAKGGAMLKFADLETIPGVRHLHASGTLAETGERVVVSFGPEHAALEQRQVEMALSEAQKLRPAPKFIVFCA
ncbi:MAG: site-specific DNA-methyltransferase, partial [Gammaproteobacteria bacterium]|nr:site-specific DNA-methyltransferase [Gammaproteobacteria bacterium]